MVRPPKSARTQRLPTRSALHAKDQTCGSGAQPPSRRFSWLNAPATDGVPILETVETLDLIHSGVVAQDIDAQPQECWRNALLSVLRHPLLADGFYVEGIAVFCEEFEENGTHDTRYDTRDPARPQRASETPTRFAHPVEHGWVELPDGRIIDPTVVLLDHPARTHPGGPRDEQTQDTASNRFGQRSGQGHQHHQAGSPVDGSYATVGGDATSRHCARAEAPPAVSPTSCLRLPSGWVIPQRLAVIYVAGPHYTRDALWSLCRAEDARPFLPFVARDQRGGFSDPSYRAAYQLAIQVVQAIS